MDYRPYTLIFVSLLFATTTSFANEVKIRSCGWGIMNALNRLEVKGAEKLEIIEFKIDKPIDHIFKDHKLVLAPLESKMQEQLSLFRRPGFSRAISKYAFAETRFIADVPTQKFTDLLDNNTVYTYSIQDKKITFAKSKPGWARNQGSKHGLLSSDPDAGPLRMAGELWKDEKGILHFDPGSGTFKPNSEDLARADIFFKQHMGITDAVPHYFDPPSKVVIKQTAPKATKTPLTQEMKKIDVAQMVITAKRRLVAGLKMTAADSSELDKMKKMEGEFITIKNAQGQDVRYQFRQIETLVKEETYFDTEDLKLHAKNNLLKTSKSFDLKNESKKNESLSENDHAVKSARKTGIGNAKLVPVVKERNEAVQLALYPVDVPKGKTPVAAFIMSLETKTTSGLVDQFKEKAKTEYFTTIEELGTGTVSREKELNQVSKQLQNRFKLSRTPATSGVEIPGASEK
ncbi:MAG: hypothetical protein H0V66_07095 [Bdellovibrionales bacterium]|nr:hypothetical protein [Bdellovibrionales bacterium]